MHIPFFEFALDIHEIMIIHVYAFNYDGMYTIMIYSHLKFCIFFCIKYDLFSDQRCEGKFCPFYSLNSIKSYIQMKFRYKCGTSQIYKIFTWKIYSFKIKVIFTIFKICQNIIILINEILTVKVHCLVCLAKCKHFHILRNIEDFHLFY